MGLPSWPQRDRAQGGDRCPLARVLGGRPAEAVPNHVTAACDLDLRRAYQPHFVVIACTPRPPANWPAGSPRPLTSTPPQSAPRIASSTDTRNRAAERAAERVRDRKFHAADNPPGGTHQPPTPPDGILSTITNASLGRDPRHPARHRPTSPPATAPPHRLSKPPHPSAAAASHHLPACHPTAVPFRDRTASPLHYLATPTPHLPATSPPRHLATPPPRRPATR
jgi:hypothetical protein